MEIRNNPVQTQDIEQSFTRRVVVMEDPEIFDLVWHMAIERGTSASAYIREAIRDRLRAEETAQDNADAPPTTQ